MRRFDVTVIGGGIVGCAVARHIARQFPSMKCAVVEKESDVGEHQTGHNSGVIHAGIYYKPGSLRAKLCIEGWQRLYEFCDENSIPYKKVGKLIIATDESEVVRLKILHANALTNGLTDVKLLQPSEFREIEPFSDGRLALHSPTTGIVCFRSVTEALAKEFVEKTGGSLMLNEEVRRISRSSDGEEVNIETNLARISSRFVIACGGLQSDRIAQMTGMGAVPKIVGFRGDYLKLKGHRRDLIRGNIYPVPNPAFPFLGVHFTPRMNGDVWLGPTATWTPSRENYGHNVLRGINMRDAVDSLTYSGFIRLACQNMGFGITEMYRSVSLEAQVAQLRRFVPTLRVEDVERGPCGVRAQALAEDGSLIEDFLFDGDDRVIHCRNAPSPAATSSLAIARVIVEKANDAFHLDKLDCHNSS